MLRAVQYSTELGLGKVDRWYACMRTFRSMRKIQGPSRSAGDMSERNVKNEAIDFSRWRFTEYWRREKALAMLREAVRSFGV